jgi:hypothetical protein
MEKKVYKNLIIYNFRYYLAIFVGNILSFYW